MPTGVYNTAWVEYVTAVLKKHGASLRSQRQRTGLSHTTVSSWLQGVKPGLDGARAFIRGFGEDEAEGLRAAGYELAAPTRTAADLAGFLAQRQEHDSPGNRMRSVLKDLYVKYTGLGWPDVPHPQTIRYFTGGEVGSEREADQHIATWLESLARRNPGQVPEELAEYAERLEGGE